MKSNSDFPILAAVRFTREEAEFHKAYRLRGLVVREDKNRPEILWSNGKFIKTPVGLIERCSLDPDDRVKTI